MLRPVFIIAGLAAVIVLGLALATVAPGLGALITVTGIVLLGAYLVAVYLRAWAGDQKRAWGPGSLRREYLAEHQPKQAEEAAAQDERTPEQR